MQKKVTITINFSVKNLQLLKKLHDIGTSNEVDYKIPSSEISDADKDNLNQLILIGLVFPAGDSYVLSDIGTVVAHRKI